MTSNQQPHGRGQSVSSGRRAALKALLAIEKAGLLPEDLFDQVAARDGLDLRDRAFMVELVRGCLRYRGTLDWRLGLLTDRPFARLPLAVQTILRLGAYQALCLDRVPDNAAVNESVGLMKGQARRLGRDWSGFVNAVLRTCCVRPNRRGLTLPRIPSRRWPSGIPAPPGWSSVGVVQGGGAPQKPFAAPRLNRRR